MQQITITPENKCSFCTTSICCTYVTQDIATPRSKLDFDNLLWQVSHDNITIYKEDSGWFLLIAARCSHLQDNGNCGIYAQRPNACRDYSNDHCEFDEPAEAGFSLLFKDYDSLLMYCKKRFKTWGT